MRNYEDAFDDIYKASMQISTYNNICLTFEPEKNCNKRKRKCYSIVIDTYDFSNSIDLNDRNYYQNLFFSINNSFITTITERFNDKNLDEILLFNGKAYYKRR